jgi:hypothetical protein
MSNEFFINLKPVEFDQFGKKKVQENLSKPLWLKKGKPEKFLYIFCQNRFPETKTFSDFEYCSNLRG